MSWLPDVVGKTISEVDCDYRRYCDMIDDDAGQPSDVAADVVKDHESVFVQEWDSEECDWPSFRRDTLSLIAAAFA